ncbi:DUF257 family protein [Thermococcus stetteri]|uniref:DUF257 family protein n=1 Tax=Thermococcus stetteri TaxID=49900 RepID=UPI001AE2E669|nr:DUF257 family protein [Thermococcus stetteri]MBP1911810.1 hypothetical protein [Thermococcus stetteri]
MSQGDDLYGKFPGPNILQGDALRPGNIVLIENNLSIGAELTFYALMEMAKTRGMSLIVEDIFDVLPVYKKHLELMGFYVPQDEPNVIKVGGIENVGNVVEKLSFEADPNLYIAKKEQVISEITEEKQHVLLTLGLERLLVFQHDLRDLYPIVRYFRNNLNSPKRMTIAIIETPVLKNKKPNPLPLLESVASSVVEFYTDGDAIVVHPKKAISPSLSKVGVLKIGIGEILEVLKDGKDIQTG